jgi:hypothetical protein
LPLSVLHDKNALLFGLFRVNFYFAKGLLFGASHEMVAYFSQMSLWFTKRFPEIERNLLSASSEKKNDRKRI